MQRENVVNLNKGLSSRAVSEDKVNDNDIGSVDLKVGPEGISSQLPEPLSVNTDKKGRNLGGCRSFLVAGWEGMGWMVAKDRARVHVSIEVVGYCEELCRD
ncbi:hypothetical protein V6N11_053738 [Hibiscus sabdariffa]|uniref:Uncharacterized protein n=1 Tax=Hibiscus sabdariffa TaxID=183260 RepID=A0ABR2S1T7_9ROSI